MPNTSPPSIELPEAPTNDTSKGEPPVPPPPTPSGEGPEPVFPRPTTDGVDDEINKDLATEPALGDAPVLPPESELAAEIAPDPKPGPAVVDPAVEPAIESAVEPVVEPVPQVLEPAPEPEVGQAVDDKLTEEQSKIEQPAEAIPDEAAPTGQPPVVGDTAPAAEDKAEPTAGVEAVPQETQDNVEPPAIENPIEDPAKPAEEPKIPAEGATKPAEDAKNVPNVTVTPVGALAPAKDPKHPTRKEKKAARAAAKKTLDDFKKNPANAGKLKAAKTKPSRSIKILLSRKARAAAVARVMKKVNGAGGANV